MHKAQDWHPAFALYAKNILMTINKNPGSRATAGDPGTIHGITNPYL